MSEMVGIKEEGFLKVEKFREPDLGSIWLDSWGGQSRYLYSSATADQDTDVPYENLSRP